MSRVKSSVTKRQRHKKVLKAARGYRGAKHRTYRSAHENLLHALSYAYRDRRQKKRDRRSLWIIKINAAARAYGLRYGEFMKALKDKGITLNRKSLAFLAEKEKEAFHQLVETVRGKG